MLQTMFFPYDNYLRPPPPLYPMIPGTFAYPPQFVNGGPTIVELEASELG